MIKQEEIQLLKMYELIQNQVSFFHEMGSPATETTAAEAKLEQMKAVLTVLNIKFTE